MKRNVFYLSLIVILCLLLLIFVYYKHITIQESKQCLTRRFDFNVKQISSDSLSNHLMVFGFDKNKTSYVYILDSSLNIIIKQNASAEVIGDAKIDPDGTYFVISEYLEPQLKSTIIENYDTFFDKLINPTLKVFNMKGQLLWSRSAGVFNISISGDGEYILSGPYSGQSYCDLTLFNRNGELIFKDDAGLNLWVSPKGNYLNIEFGLYDKKGKRLLDVLDRKDIRDLQYSVVSSDENYFLASSSKGLVLVNNKGHVLWQTRKYGIPLEIGWGFLTNNTVYVLSYKSNNRNKKIENILNVVDEKGRTILRKSFGEDRIISISADSKCIIAILEKGGMQKGGNQIIRLDYSGNMLWSSDMGDYERAILTKDGKFIYAYDTNTIYKFKNVAIKEKK